MPAAQPESQGELILLDSLDFSSEQSVDIEADAFVTVRLVETATAGFGWEAPDQVWQCVTLESTNLGDF